MRVNRAKDFIERVAWTAIQAFAGSLLVTGFDDWRIALGIAGTAALVSALKVTVAQNVGRHQDGAAIPGGVIEGPGPRP